MAYEGSGNTSEMWGSTCPGCGSPTGGIDRAVHTRLVDAAESRGVALQNAVVARLSRDLNEREAELARAKRRIKLLALLCHASAVMVRIERWWHRVFSRRLKP